MKKIFVSSVMRDFEQERSAVRTAVESLRQKPVMAEDFGAKPYSSQIACVEGVRQSDVYVGIMGLRYGFVTKAGISVTEEEFTEARRRGLPVLWFIQKTEMEPAQKAFLDRIRGYEEGYFLDFFTGPQDLQAKITRSLFDLIGDPDISNLDGAAANQHVTQYLKTSQIFPDHSTIATGIIFPARQGETYISQLALGRDDLKASLMQRALFGTGAVLRPSMATATVEGHDHLRFLQTGSHNRFAGSIEVHIDGTLLFNRALGEDEKQGFMSGGMAAYVIDQDELENHLSAFFNFASAFYNTLEASAMLSTFYAAVALRNLNYKSFGRRPKSPVNSMAMPTNPLSDPLLIPSSPLKLARAEVIDGPALAKQFVAHAERTFKVQNRYFGSK